MHYGDAMAFINQLARYELPNKSSASDYQNPHVAALHKSVARLARDARNRNSAHVIYRCTPSLLSH